MGNLVFKPVLPVEYQAKLTVKKAVNLQAIPAEIGGVPLENIQGQYIAAMLERETGKEVKAVPHKFNGKICLGKLRQVSANSDGSLVWIADLLTNGRKFSVSVKENSGKKVFDLISAKSKVILANSETVQEKKTEYLDEKGRILNSL